MLNNKQAPYHLDEGISVQTFSSCSTHLSIQSTFVLKFHVSIVDLCPKNGIVFYSIVSILIFMKIIILCSCESSMKKVIQLFMLNSTILLMNVKMPTVEPVLKNEDKVSCRRTQHRTNGFLGHKL